MALALDETEERSKSFAIVWFVCLSLAGGRNFMTSLARFAIKDAISSDEQKHISNGLLTMYGQRLLHCSYP